VNTTWWHFGHSSGRKPRSGRAFSRCTINTSVPMMTGINWWTACFRRVTQLSSIIADGKPISRLGNSGASWHSDMTYVEVPPPASVLLGIEIPDVGGDTYFADQNTAYESLPAELKNRIRDLTIKHDARTPASASCGQASSLLMIRGMHRVRSIRSFILTKKLVAKRSTSAVANGLTFRVCHSRTVKNCSMSSGAMQRCLKTSGNRNGNPTT